MPDAALTRGLHTPERVPETARLVRERMALVSGLTRRQQDAIRATVEEARARLVAGLAEMRRERAMQMELF